MCLRIPAADDDHVLVKHARRGERNGLLREIAAQFLAQIDASRFAESGNRLACLRIQAIEKIHDPCKDATPLAVNPVGHSSRRLVGANAGVELPSSGRP